MPYTQADVVGLVRGLLNEPTEAFWLTSELESWVLQGTIDVSTKSHCVEQIVLLNLTPGVANYALGVDTLGIDSILIANQALVRLRSRSLGHVHAGDADLPTHFAYFGGQVRVFGTPQVAAEAVVHRWRRVANVAEVPDHYQLLVIWYAVMMAKLKDRKFTEAAQLYTMYTQALLFERQDLQDYAPDSREMLGIPDRIVSTGNGR